MSQDPRAFVKVNVPHIPTPRKEVSIMPNSLLVGIDVSSCDNKVRLLDSLVNSLLKFTVSNNYPGAKLLLIK
jgi:hypothetical protein